MKGGVNLLQITNGLGSFLTAITGDATMLTFISILIAVAIGGMAFGFIRRFLKR